MERALHRESANPTTLLPHPQLFRERTGQERSGDDVGPRVSAIQSVEAEFSIPVVSVARLEHLFLYVQEQGSEGDAGALGGIAAYREKYGVAYDVKA